MVLQHVTEKVTIDNPKPFYFVRTTTDKEGTEKTRKTFMVKGTDHTTGKPRSILASEAAAKKFGKPTLIVSSPSKKKAPKKSCQEKFDECEAKKVAKKRKPKAKKVASAAEESEEEASEEQQAASEEEPSEEEEERVSTPKKPSPKRKPAKKAGKAKAKGKAKAAKRK